MARPPMMQTNSLGGLGYTPASSSFGQHSNRYTRGQYTRGQSVVLSFLSSSPFFTRSSREFSIRLLWYPVNWLQYARAPIFSSSLIQSTRIDVSE